MAKIKENEVIKKKLSILKASFFISNCILIISLFVGLLPNSNGNHTPIIILILILNGILLGTYSIINKCKDMLGEHLRSDIMRKYSK